MEKSKSRCESNDIHCEILLNSVSDTLYVIGGKWKLRIIIALFNGTKRFNDLQRTVTGISARVLSNELKDLEINGFLNRKINSETFAVIKEYELTEYSFTLKEVVNALSNWGINHRIKLKEK